MTPWIGIDPGATRTGLVLRLGTECAGWKTIERQEDETVIGPGPMYWDEIEESLVYLQFVAVKMGAGAAKIALEGVVEPSPFPGKRGEKRFARPKDVMALSMTFGAIYTRHPDAVLIPPKQNGRGALSYYPDLLVSARERSDRRGMAREAGDSSLESHARSAWDVAGKAVGLWRAA
jgi:hypothetical protein